MDRYILYGDDMYDSKITTYNDMESSWKEDL